MQTSQIFYRKRKGKENERSMHLANNVADTEVMTNSNPRLDSFHCWDVMEHALNRSMTIKKCTQNE